MQESPDLQSMSDEVLLRRLSELLKQSRRVEADLVSHIAEVDARRLYARAAAPSMFAYCTEILHLSEPEAYLRIAVARASRRHPVLLTLLGDGRLHLSGIERLAPHLTEENRDRLLEQAAHRSKREIEELVATLAPRPSAPATIRKLPLRRWTDATGDAVDATEPGPDPVAEPGSRPGAATQPDGRLRPDGVPGSSTSNAERPATVEPLAATRFRVRFDANAELRDKLERLQALMRSSVPDGDLAKIIGVAVTEKLERLEARRFAKTKSPRKDIAQTSTAPQSRYIPAAVRRIVEKRDGGRCTYRDEQGRQCTSRHDLEFHHRTPFGRGGDHSPHVICLMCKTHNTLMAERDYGTEVMARYRRRPQPGGRVSEAAVPYAVSARNSASG